MIAIFNRNGSAVFRFTSALWIVPAATTYPEVRRVEQDLMRCPLIQTGFDGR